jgi:hypothetical protein
MKADIFPAHELFKKLGELGFSCWHAAWNESEVIKSRTRE